MYYVYVPKCIARFSTNCSVLIYLVAERPLLLSNRPVFRAQATPGLNLTPDDFAWITSQVLSVARICCPGRCVSVLEGGYGQWKHMRIPVAAPSAAAPSAAAAAAAATDGVASSAGLGAASDAGTASSAAVTTPDLECRGADPAAAAAVAAAGGSTTPPSDTPTNASVSAAAAAAVVPQPEFTIVPYLKRDTLGECCAEQLRSLCDDGAALGAEGLSANYMSGE